MMDSGEASNDCPKGHAALGRSTFLKPPALPEVADSIFWFPSFYTCTKFFKVVFEPFQICLMIFFKQRFSIGSQKFIMISK